jgi:hypothetical protein
MTKTEWRHEIATEVTDAWWFLGDFERLVGYSIREAVAGNLRFELTWSDGFSFLNQPWAAFETLECAKAAAEAFEAAGIRPDLSE